MSVPIGAIRLASDCAQSLARSWQAALRNLGRAPAFSSLVVLTLALGIGATTAMFSVVDAVVINKLPFPHADRLLEVWINFEDGADRRPAIMNQIVAAIRSERELFDAVSGYGFEGGTITDGGEPAQLSLVSLSTVHFQCCRQRRWSADSLLRRTWAAPSGRC